MRRGAAGATAALSVLLSLALGTSAVALREEPGKGPEVGAAPATNRPTGRPEPVQSWALPPVARVLDDGRGPGTGSDQATARPAAAVEPDAPSTTAPATDDAGGVPAGPTGPAPQTAAAATAPTPDCAVLSCVALTFDDGPGPDTGRLLDELAARGVSATFFVVGREVAKQPATVAREVAAGHVVGNHTWDHAALPSLAPDAVAAELDATDQAVVAAGAPQPILARPPYGSVSPAVGLAYAARGMVGVLWDVDTEDWKNRDAGITTQRALDGAHPGAIILMHDIRPSTIDAVPGLVDALRARGYTLVTVPQLLVGATPGSLYRHR